MRRTEIVVIAAVLINAQIFAALPSRAQDSNDKSAGSQASVPRASAKKYAAHGEQEGISIGAELLTRKQVAKEFVAEVNRCCVVVRVAVFPKNDKALQLSLDDFSLEVEGSDIPVRPQGANAIAAILEKKSNSNVGVTTGAGIGYESGSSTDPSSGQRTKVHGVYTTASVEVAIGASAPPTVADREREAMAHELGEKGLPEANISVPVAGYLYFSIPKPKKDAHYRLEYSLKSGSLVLKLHS